MKTMLVCIFAAWFAFGSCSLAGRSKLTEISRHPSVDGHWAVVQFKQDNGPTSHPEILVKLIPLIGQTGSENERTLLAYVGYHPAQVQWISDDQIVLVIDKEDSFKLVDQMALAWGKKIDCRFK